MAYAAVTPQRGLDCGNERLAKRVEGADDAFGKIKQLRSKLAGRKRTPLWQCMMPTSYALALPGLRTRQGVDGPNIIGGWDHNTVTAGVSGATNSGGGGNFGSTLWTNRVTDDYGAVGGGANNTAGNDQGNLIDSAFAAVGGGFGNQAADRYATAAGGLACRIPGLSRPSVVVIATSHPAKLPLSSEGAIPAARTTSMVRLRADGAG